MKKTLAILCVTLCVMFSCKPEEDDSAIEPQINKINGHEYVDLGLPSGLKWATCNVGASSPEYYGGSYAWGETEKNDPFTYGMYMDDISGNPNYDVARDEWGGSWRMPTKSDMEELIIYCTSKWIKKNGVNGFALTGPNGNSIFIPANKSTEFYACCTFWTSTPYRNDDEDSDWVNRFSYYTVFEYDYDDYYDIDGVAEIAMMNRNNLYYVRPVTN